MCGRLIGAIKYLAERYFQDRKRIAIFSYDIMLYMDLVVVVSVKYFEKQNQDDSIRFHFLGSIMDRPQLV